MSYAKTQNIKKVRKYDTELKENMIPNHKFINNKSKNKVQDQEKLLGIRPFITITTKRQYISLIYEEMLEKTECRHQF